MKYMTYKLSWKVSKVVPIPCPDRVPDPYTGEYPSLNCLVYHTKQVTQEMSREFSTLEELEAFKKAAPLVGCFDWKVERIINYKVNENPNL